MHEGKRIIVKEGNSYAEFSSIGAYLIKLVLNGVEIIRKSNDGISTHGGAAVLIPFGNRIRNAEYTYNGKKYLLPKNDGKNSIHGLVRDINFDYETENTQAIFT
ncbi:MAG: aldose 1-epimerase, partial [Ferroplasma sp.]